MNKVVKMADRSSRVEVGCLEKPEEAWTLESRFFPSKVGGKPAWLDLKNISINVSCNICSNPSAFLCQVYAPIDGQDNAYHRTIYVFVCKNPDCNRANNNNNLKVFRCQLPRLNEFYVPEEPTDEPDWHPESKIERFTPTCEVCGTMGPYQCGKCKWVKYCSKQHQVLDWKMGHKDICSTNKLRSNTTDFLFPEYEMVIESEDTPDEHGIQERKEEKSDEERLREFNEFIESGKGGTLQDVSPEVLENYALHHEDKFIKNFKAKLSLCPDQVLRYDRGGEPLWIAAPDIKSEDIPKCEHCGGPRQFEFQILPTLLNYLDVDQLDKSLDWGNLLIYTCTNNCGNGPAYKNEFVWKQDIS